MTGSRYLDAAATAPLRPEARAAIIEALDAGVGNASSVHSAGHRARAIIEDARARIAEAFGARPAEVVFTSGGTEANNLAVIGAALASSRGRHIITSAVEHPSVTESIRFLERMHGFEVTTLPVDELGVVSAERAADAIRSDTALVSIGLANGEIGTVQTLSDLVRSARARGVPVHTDAVQAAATLPTSFAPDGWPGASVDLMSIGSHKFGGPHGAGALLVRTELALEPILHGGGQERGMRSGTENVAAIAGFAAAVEAVARQVGTRAMALGRSRDDLVALMLERVPGARLTGHPSERLPGHASFVFGDPGTGGMVSGESLLVALDAAGIAASSGSACAAGKDEPSPVLLATGCDPVLAHTALRFTLSDPPGGAARDLVERVVEVVRSEVVRNRGVPAHDQRIHD